MFVNYQKLPKNSRVWIYQSNREFTLQEIEFISGKAKKFIENWTKHGSDLQGSFTVKYNQFLALAVDEGFNNVSGCSIDTSVRFVQKLEKDLNVDMMNKTNISFKQGDDINIVNMNVFKKFARENKVTNKTIVFNNMVTTKDEFENKWEVPINQSWHKKLLV